MEDQLISLETAKLAKEKGFKPERDWNPDYVKGYIEHAEYKLTEIREEDWIVEGYYLAPTQSLLQKWLRELHKIHICIDFWYEGDTYFTYVFRNAMDKIEVELKGLSNDPSLIKTATYEQALEIGLQEALKLI